MKYLLFFSPFPSTSKFRIKLRATNGGNGQGMRDALLTDKHFNGRVVVCSFSSLVFFCTFNPVWGFVNCNGKGK